MDEELLRKNIQKYARILAEADGDAKKVEYALHRLESIPLVTYSLLSETAIGKTVNAFRNHPIYGQRALNLVTKWREQVTAEAVSFGITVVNSAAETGVQRQESRKCVAIKEEPKIHVKNEIVEDDEEFGSNYYIPTPIKSISPSERHKQKTPFIKNEPIEHDADGQVFEQYTYKQNELSIGPSHDIDKQVIKNEPLNEEQSSKTIRKHLNTEESHKVKRKRKKPAEDADPFMAALDAASDSRRETKKLHSIKRPNIQAISDGIKSSIADFAESNYNSNGNTSTLQSFNSAFALSQVLSNKSSRTRERVYAGRRKLHTNNGSSTNSASNVPSLFSICIRYISKNINEVLDVKHELYIPYHVIKPVLNRCTPEQLKSIQWKNSYLRADTDELWKNFCVQHLQNCDKHYDDDEAEDGDEIGWQRKFYSLLEECKYRTRAIVSEIKSKNSASAGAQRTALTTAPITPRDVRRRQIRNGVRVVEATLPSAAELSRSRRQIFESGDRSALLQMPSACTSGVGHGGFSAAARSTTSFEKPKKTVAPLMAKTLRMWKSMRR